jgi:hypothetical protein
VLIVITFFRIIDHNNRIRTSACISSHVLGYIRIGSEQLINTDKTHWLSSPSVEETTKTGQRRPGTWNGNRLKHGTWLPKDTESSGTLKQKGK